MDASHCGARYSYSSWPLLSDLDLYPLTHGVNGTTNPKEFLLGCFQDTMTEKVGRMDGWVEVLSVIIKKNTGKRKVLLISDSEFDWFASIFLKCCQWVVKVMKVLFVPHVQAEPHKYPKDTWNHTKIKTLMNVLFAGLMCFLILPKRKMQTSCLNQQRAAFTNILQPMRHFIHEVLPKNKRQVLI